MSKDGYYVMALNWAMTCLKEADSDDEALWLINGWAQSIAEEAFKQYQHLKEQQNEGNSQEQANPEP